MKWIYVDNFRGFNDQFIPITDVNFLLGENSTGKSSILALLNLFASTPFWLHNTFNNNDFEFGNFKDIASVNSTNPKNFRIGLIDCPAKLTKDNKDSIFVSLMEYIDKDGVPSISRYNYISESHAVRVFLSESNIKYNVDDIKFDGDITKTVMDKFKHWVKKVPNEERLSILKLPRQFKKEKTLPFIRSMIDGEMKKDKKHFSFSLQIPDDLTSLAWIAPIRTKPKRTYDQFKYTFSPEGDHSPYLVRQILKGKNKKYSEAFLDFITKFGKKSGLLSSIGVKKFGKDSSSPFQLEIVLEDKPLNISSVGYGVSQALPIMIELFARRKNSFFAIQQPEVHLHPRAQAALGDVFYFVAQNDNKKLLIETHSDFIIDRFRTNINKNKKNIDSQVLFFERVGGFNKVYSIPIHKDGKYDENQPESFRSFFIKEELDLLRMR